MADRDVLSNMFSSFVSRKFRSPSQLPAPLFSDPVPHDSSHSLPPLPLVNPFAGPGQLQVQIPPTHSLTYLGSQSPSRIPSHRQPSTVRTHAQSSSGPDQSGTDPSKCVFPTRSHTSHVSKTHTTSVPRHFVSDANSPDDHKVTLGSSSVRGATGSAGSVEAIATDTTTVATPFHCDKCSKAFRQRSQLSRHYLRVHERKKPFACAHCDKHFASAFDRKRHVEVSLNYSGLHSRACTRFCTSTEEVFLRTFNRDDSHLSTNEIYTALCIPFSSPAFHNFRQFMDDDALNSFVTGAHFAVSMSTSWKHIFVQLMSVIDVVCVERLLNDLPT